MAQQWTAEIDTPKGQGKLNGHLGKQSYINGWTPSADDVTVFNAIKDVGNKFAHIKRWHNHIASFSPKEREHFGEEDYVEEQPKPNNDDDDLDFFTDDAPKPTEEDLKRQQAEKDRLLKEKEEKDKKGKKEIIEKSNVVFNVKPADAETKMDQLEEFVRGIQMEGLDWKASELLDLAFGVKTLKISCNLIDKLVSVDDIEESMMLREDLISSVEILTFTKL